MKLRLNISDDNKKLYTNKYFLTFAFFIVWMVLIDSKDVITLWRHNQVLQTLKTKELYYDDLIQQDKDLLEDLKNKKYKVFEKIAREKYRMKRPNEDIFIFN
ncbi:MAG: hypothetical protein QM528_05090 [Phycisphaerales bacterium]|nr:hypothetical protein [Phycisphaerales bacterium]